MSGLDTSQMVTDEASLQEGHLDKAAHKIEAEEKQKHDAERPDEGASAPA
jgi:hypothetical protein